MSADPRVVAAADEHVADDHGGWRLPYAPQLDGFRAIAVLLVIASHGPIPGFEATAGGTGVTMFFTLSGFLITSLLLQERRRFGVVRFGAFYARRALRLLPALVVVVAATAAHAVATGANDHLALNAFGVLFYAANWLRIDGHDLGLLHHTWSLAVEEQFYIVWPVMLTTALVAVRQRHHRLVAPVLLLAAASAVESSLLWHGEGSVHRVGFGSDTVACALLLGCALALWLQGRSAPRAPRWVEWLGWAALCGVTALQPGPATYYRYGFQLVALGAGAAIAAIVLRPPGPILSSSAARWIGRRSYGLYLWHVPIMSEVGVRLDGHPNAVVIPLGVMLSFAAAAVSYRLVEAPFLRLKERFEPAGRTSVPGPA